MDHCKLPKEILGNWIWKKSLINAPNSSLLVRKEFLLSQSHSVADFWISANCSYQLFINERLVGFGPRANHSACSTYVDEYDLSYYLQQGSNVIAVVVSHTLPKKSHRTLKIPGLWCQLNLDSKAFMWTDSTWEVFESDNFTKPCSFMSDKRGMTESIDYKLYPADWMKTSGNFGSKWFNPDYVTSIQYVKDNLEICPLSPNSVDEIYFFENLSKGAYSPSCAMTHFNFNDIFTDPGIYAAVTFLFMESKQQIEVEVFADDPYKFFCNKTLVKSKRKQDDSLFGSENNKITLKLKAGWNRLLILQEIEEDGVGITFAFPSIHSNELKLFQDTIEDAETSWNIAGPLRMPLSEATPSISFERLNSQSYIPSLENALDISSYLKYCDYTLTETEPSMSVMQGEYLLFKLEELKYGFLSIEIKASEGDIIDVTLGQYIDQNDFPMNADNIKNTHTMTCCAGVNKFLKFKPEEVCYLMVSVRKAAGKVEVNDLIFSEFTRTHHTQTSFKCSDEELNEIWRIGCNSIQRTSSFICQNESSILNTCCLGDFYFQSCNLINIFGDYHLAEVWLRNFSEAQFENGNIPAISFGEKVYSQISHLFLFSTWMLFHYRASANDEFLKKTAPHLDLIFELFKSLTDEKTGLFKNVDKHFKSNCRLNTFVEQESGISTTINALYCRFLLSAGEIYRALERPKDLFKCFKQAAIINKKLNETNWNPEKHLFASSDLDSENCSDLFTNFIAVYSGVAPNNEFENIFEEFFRLEIPFARNPEQSDLPYFNFLFTETMFALGQTQWILEYIRDYWTRRIDKESSAWRISPDSKKIATTDFFRGNTVCPNTFLLSEVVGIRVAEPGYTTIYFNPALDFVKWAKVVFPTAYGSIKLEWELLEDSSLNVIIDAKFPLKVLPELSSEMLKNTSFSLGKNVTLLDAETMPEAQA
jgi:Bacterial alpha-L-rhamnosidase C-terminal domain